MDDPKWQKESKNTRTTTDSFAALDHYSETSTVVTSVVPQGEVRRTLKDLQRLQVTMHQHLHSWLLY